MGEEDRHLHLRIGVPLMMATPILKDAVARGACEGRLDVVEPGGISGEGAAWFGLRGVPLRIYSLALNLKGLQDRD